MTQNRIRTTLEEDFKELGMLTTSRSVNLSGIISEDNDNPNNNDKTPKPKEFQEDSDLFDGEYATKELFDRILALPIENLKEEDIQEILDGISEKKIDDSDKELIEQAEQVIKMLKEGVANRQRRFKSGSTARKMSFQCPQGQRAVKTGGGRPVCRPSHIVAGGMGKIAKERRKKKKWSRGGKGTISQMKSARAERRRKSLRSEEESFLSPLAQELLQISEDVSRTTTTVRDEIVERIVNIIDFLNEEFCDDAVADIYTESIDSIIDTYEAGRLEEDVMDDDEFITELDPMLRLITKSLSKLDNDEVLGND